MSSIAIAGLLPVALVAPQVMGALEKLGVIKLKEFRVSRIDRSLINLIKNGLVVFHKTNKGKQYLTLTKKGEQHLNHLEIQNFKLEKPKNWDKKWRIIIFDIPEKKRRSRDQLRHTLSRIGFIKIQNSVWAYPYDCEDLVILLKADLELGRNLLYIIAEELENDKKLKQFFNPPL